MVDEVALEFLLGDEDCDVDLGEGGDDSLAGGLHGVGHGPAALRP
ncbi:hypothetical protein [Streptomyces sp. NWU339]|nr:hypothetical protein [Streptomyces sp. NWU339]